MACTQYAKLRYLSGSSLDPGEMFLTFSGVPAPCGLPRVLSNRRAHPAHIPEPRSWSLVSRESELHPAPASREAGRLEVASGHSGCARETQGLPRASHCNTRRYVQENRGGEGEGFGTELH